MKNYYIILAMGQMRIPTSFTMQTTSYIIMETRDRVRDWVAVSQGRRNRIESNGETGRNWNRIKQRGEGIGGRGGNMDN